MRAGVYAVFHGEVFRCIGRDGSRRTLLSPLSGPQPEGFEKHARGWRRLVDRSEISRMFAVSTVAVWQGHRVEVESVWEDQATLSATGNPQDVPRHPAVETDRGYGDWRATVPVWELTEVVETVRDVSP